MTISPRTTDDLDELISRPTSGVIATLSRHPGQIAVLGAGGKMGYHTCRMLQRAQLLSGQPMNVLAVSRFGDAKVRDRFLSADIGVHVANLSDSDQVDALPDADVAFFMAGIKFGTASNRDLLHRMNVQMPQLIAHRYRSCRIVALSTGCVYGFVTPQSGGSTETSPTNPPGDYARSCLGREQAFVDASNASGTQCCLIRLNYSNELRYGVLVDIAQRVLSGQPVTVDMGHVNVIWQGDAVAHIIQSLDHACSPPAVLNVTGPETLSVRDLAMEFGARFKIDPRFEGVEPKTAWLNNATRSHRLFGVPRTSVDQMIDWIADWLRRGKSTLDKPTHFEVRDGDY